MEFDHLLVRYGELTLKGTNRKKVCKCFER